MVSETTLFACCSQGDKFLRRFLWYTQEKKKAKTKSKKTLLPLVAVKVAFYFDYYLCACNMWDNYITILITCSSFQVKQLLNYHPNLLEDMSAVRSHTSLHLAAKNGHMNVVSYFLSCGMDVNITVRLFFQYLFLVNKNIQCFWNKKWYPVFLVGLEEHKNDWSFEETNSLSVQEDPRNNVKNNNQIKLTIEPSHKTKELQCAYIVGVQRNKRHYNVKRYEATDFQEMYPSLSHGS